IVAPVVVSYIYKTLIYDPSFGYLNYFLRLLNLPQFIVIKGVINPIMAILVMEIILRTPFVTLILYAGITSVPDTILEASEMDGAHLRQRIFNIIIPYIRPIIVVAFVFRFMDALKMFDEVYVLTRGGPGNITENISLFATDQGFAFHRISYSAASTMIYLVIVIIIMNVILKVTRFNED
ncbi:MAG: sugar ABC transporter permease, partial [Clostridiaceae bacterium]|nr:sugar ABC transporter permease [Clostridiaceae bacterium]